MKILMVCLGNICRSPLAQGILESKIKALNLDWKVDSAGTSGFHDGEMPDSRSIDIANENGIAISHQSSRRVEKKDFEIFDLIFAMDQSNYNDLLGKATDEQKSKIHLVMNMISERNESIPDPYYNNGFPLVFQMLDRACDAIIKKYL